MWLSFWLLVHGCTSDGPTLVVAAPIDGRELGGDGTDTIEVSGTVSARRDVVVTVDGSPVSVDDSGAWATSVPATFGHHHLEITAERRDVREEVHLDVLWADVYDAPTPGPTYAVTSAATLRLAGSALDDGTGLDLSGPTTVTDLADLAQVIGEAYDYTPHVPAPWLDQPPSQVVNLLSPTPGTVVASVSLSDGVFDVTLHYPAFELDMEGYVDIAGRIPVDGHLSADVIVSIPVTLTDGLAIELGEPAATIASLTGSFDDGEASGWFDVVGTTLVADAIVSAMQSAVPDVATAVFDVTLSTVDDGLGEPYTGDVDLSNPAPDVWVATMATTLSTGEPAAHPDSRGVADGISAAPEVDASSLAVRIAAFNAALHAWWNAGGLTSQAVLELPSDRMGTPSSVDSALPPLLHPIGDGLALTLSGQVTYGEGTLVGFFITVPASVQLADSAAVLDLSGPADVHTWWSLLSEDAPRPDIARLEAALAQQYWPALRTDVEAAARVPVPTLDGGDLGGVAPALSGFRLDVEATGAATLGQGHVVFDIGLVGPLPESSAR